MKKGLGRCWGECSAIDGEFIQVETAVSPADKDPEPQSKDEKPQVFGSDKACCSYASIFDAIK